MSRLLSAACAALFALSCAGPQSEGQPAPVEGTTYRVGPNVPTPGSRAMVEIFRDWKRCATVFRDESTLGPEFKDNEARIHACLPRVDRQQGAVHVAWRVADSERNDRALLLPLTKESVAISHRGHQQQIFDFIAHEPTRPGQLFVVLIDHSQSMKQTDTEGVSRMQRVADALWANRSVFISKDSAIVLFRFTDTVEGVDGSPWTETPIITDNATLQQSLGYLGSKAGWTHLYNAVQVAVNNILVNEKSTVGNWMNNHDVLPTIIVLTDGFNNTKSSEVCQDNAEPLEATLKIIQEARRSRKLSQQPIIYTVGFGVPMRPRWLPPEDEVNVTAMDLCGDYKDYRIDRGLDTVSIDNVSLRWMAAVGGGEGFIKSDYKELAGVFAGTAPTRYSWYEVNYRVPGFYHRTSFRTRIRLVEQAQADSYVEFSPSGWIDGPGVDMLPTGDMSLISIRHAAALVMPFLGLFVLMGYLGPAMFNGRRAIFRRSWRRK